jgi:hypothetical protein
MKKLTFLMLFIILTSPTLTFGEDGKCIEDDLRVA